MERVVARDSVRMAALFRQSSFLVSGSSCWSISDRSHAEQKEGGRQNLTRRR